MSAVVKFTGWALFLLGIVLAGAWLIGAVRFPEEAQAVWLLGPLTYGTIWPVLVSGGLLILFGRLVDLLGDIGSELHALRTEARLSSSAAKPA
jgi:hypothetical protein